MAPSRYTHSRTLVRRLCRLPDEDRAASTENVRLLRVHFERDNRDTAELCQWWMGLRKRYGLAESPASFGVLGDFLLEPGLMGGAGVEDADEHERDRWRRDVFDHVAGLGGSKGRPLTQLGRSPHTVSIPEELSRAIEQAASDLYAPGNTTAARLFARLGTLHPSHRLVLCKSAAEWIVARYQRGMENWVRQHAEWASEKAGWEAKHPELTPALRDRFTGVFKRLKVNKDETEAVSPDDTETPSKTGVRRKNPRICRYERLRLNTDNCCYAGQKGHGQQCWKYREFRKQRKEKNKKFSPPFFDGCAQNLLRYCQDKGYRSPSKVLSSHNIANVLFAQKPQQARQHLRTQFKHDWDAYMGLVEDNEETTTEAGCLRHCVKMGDEKGLKLYEESECQHNEHTGLCKQYHRLLTAEFGDDDKALALEGLYRDWRRFYLAGPRKPQFEYPSAKDLPMPKVFGAGFFELDMERSVLRLRLEDMPKGEWLEVGFIPWPKGYSPSRAEAADRVTSVHVNFVGNRVRLGFHFLVEHTDSRFGVSQDQIDALRSRVYPRRAQDNDFLNAARTKLLDSFAAPGPEKSLRMLSVDMGMSGAHVAVFEGRTPRRDEPLKINKGKFLYEAFPDKEKGKDKRKDKDQRKDKGKANNTGKGKKQTPDAPDQSKLPEQRGLRREHVGRHLGAIAKGDAALAEHRAGLAEEQEKYDAPGVPLASDFRGLKRHIAWMARDWSRLNAKQIIQAAEKHKCDLIVFESLRGKRLPGFDQLGADNDRKKQEQLLYAYGRVRQKVKEKAVERGMRVVTVPYHRSSQFCATCGKPFENRGLWKKNKMQKKKFICEHKECKAHKKPVDSDANAARVLGRVFWGEIVLPDPE